MLETKSDKRHQQICLENLERNPLLVLVNLAI